MAPDLIDELRRRLVREPHKQVDEIISSVRETGRSAGEDLAKFLDSLPLGKKGPHRTVDALLDGLEKGFEEAQHKIKQRS